MKPILDESKRQKICGVLVVGGTYQLAARAVGCSRHTIRNTAKRDPAFAEMLQKAKANPELFFLNTIRQAALEPKYWPAAKWALQHMYPDRYSRKAWTMSIAEVKELVTQLVGSIVEVIPDRHIRAEVRRRVYRLTGAAIRKTKKDRHGK
jgi:hypothetical protein